MTNKEIFDLAVKKAGLDKNRDNLLSVTDILDGTECPQDMPQKVMDYLDQTCCNKPDSRWTWHGCTVAQQCSRLLKAYKEIEEGMQ